MRFLAAVLCVSAIGALADAPDATSLAGTWEGRFNGTVYCVLKVAPGAALSGTMSLGDIRTDSDGDLTSVGAAPAEESPLIKPHIENGQLLFGLAADPGDDPISMQLSITSAGQAELSILSLPANAGKVKPLKLTRKE